MTRIQSRTVPQQAFNRLADAGLHPLLARLYAARGIRVNSISPGGNGVPVTTAR